MVEPVPPAGEPAIRATAMSADNNPYGTIFVGWLMGQMALAAGSVASRHSGARAPVVAADGFAFTAPVVAGDEVSFHAAIVGTGRSSMTVAVEVWRRDRHGEGTTRAARGTFVLVAMGEDGAPKALNTTPTTSDIKPLLEGNL
ncbi:hotdog domain-containing protein [Sphingomonas sp. H39-1-10]|uniref:acyl-CoA thioesterase n=1 Tax=Sphingomonas pollutisoli TaxID=3030829 RepID=UPI0023B91EF5|nr:hotdog domain-containing protein [Sphingomonas pollutisoli]MDF0488957.1 hotdog domain-containing protein [Sphingomonas pollutisoli]